MAYLGERPAAWSWGWGVWMLCALVLLVFMAALRRRVSGDPFLAETHEGTYDDLVQLTQQLLEELSRRPALPYDTLQILRNIFFPRPKPLVLWGWDALGTGISYYDPAIVHVIPATVGDPGALAAGWYQSAKTVTITAALS